MTAAAAASSLWQEDSETSVHDQLKAALVHFLSQKAEQGSQRPRRRQELVGLRRPLDASAEHGQEEVGCQSIRCLW